MAAGEEGQHSFKQLAGTQHLKSNFWFEGENSFKV